MNDTIVTPTPAGPVTLDDVRAVLASTATAPNATNAGAVRKLLGRGSLSTIQKHLDTLRAESAPQPLDVIGTVPDVPKDLIGAVWTHAWTTAQARTAGALVAVQTQQAATAQALAVAQADAAAAQQEADYASQALEEAQEQAQKAQEAHAAALEAAQALAAAQQAQQALELAQARSDLEHVQQAAALEKAEHAAAVAALRGEVDRLINQLADLRAALGGK
jgi:Plasmid replication region DNA-binding N-term